MCQSRALTGSWNSLPAPESLVYTRSQMDERHDDARGKIRDLERLLAGSASGDELFASAMKAKLALDFRATDAMIGLDEVDPSVLDTLRGMTQRALAAAASAAHVEAGLELGQWALDTSSEAAARDAVLAMARFADHEPTGRAHRLLGYLAFHGLGCPKNVVTSFGHHRAAASCGDADAMFELYVMFIQGLGTTADADEALLWCERAADAGNVRAMANLGGMYATGRGVEQSDAVAIGWYEKAAQAGHGKAAATLGVMHATGNGAPQDLPHAKHWLERADDLGYDWRPLAEAVGMDVDAVFGASKKKAPKKTKRKTKASATPKKKALPKAKKKKTATSKKKAAPKTKAKATSRKKAPPKKKRKAPQKK
jgi:TPR repeat protein